MTSGKAALLVAVVAGLSFAVGRWTGQKGPVVLQVPTVTAPIISEKLKSEAPAISEAEAKDLRASNYASVDSIEKVLDLPTDYAQTEALYILAGRADQPELEQLIAQSMSVANRHDRAAALRILFSRFAELDPNAAVDYLIAINLDISDQIFPIIFDDWSKTDLNAAIAKANLLTNIRQRTSASRAILMATARFNEGLLDQVADSLIEAGDADQFRGEAIGARANTDPLGALQEALSLKGMSGRYGTIYRVAIVWARNDPAGALQSIDIIADANMREQFVGQVVTRWIQDDSEQAMQYINSEPDAQARNMMLKNALGVYAQSNPEAAMNVALQMRGDTGVRALQQVMASWATTDPTSAMLALNLIESPAKRNQIIQNVGHNLSMHGSDKVLEWLDALDVETRSSQMGMVLMQIAQHEPRRALEYVMANSTEADLGNTLVSVLQTASRANPGIVQDYIAQLPAGTNTDGLYRQIASNLAANDGQATLQWIDGLTGSAKVSALSGAAATLALNDPDLASTLITQMPNDAGSHLLQNIGVQMSRNDPAGALVWLEQHRGRSGYENAVASVIKWSARSDPRSAAILASRTHPSVRDTALGSVAAIWGRSNSRQATSWALSLPAGAGRDMALGNLVSSVPADIPNLSSVVSSIASDASRNSAIQQAYSRLLAGDNNQAMANAFLDDIGALQELRDQLQGGGRQ